MEKDNIGISLLKVKEKEDFVIDIKGPEEPQEASYVRLAGNSTGCGFVPAQVETHVEKICNEYGEELKVDTRNKLMYAEKKTCMAASYGIHKKTINRTGKRKICNGYICECKKIVYEKDAGLEYFYEITTKTQKDQSYTLEITTEDMQRDIVFILEKEGGIEFVNQRRRQEDAELVRSFVFSEAEICGICYPFIPSWKNGTFVFSTRRHVPKTPFFLNFIKLDGGYNTELVTLNETIQMLKICRTPRVRLFFIILTTYIILQSAFPEALKLGVPVSVNINKNYELFVMKILNIFEGVKEYRCSLTESQEKVDEVRQNRRGIVVFIDYTDVFQNTYYRKKIAGNLEYLLGTCDKDTVTVIINKASNTYIEGALNITVSDKDIDEEAYVKINDNAGFLTRFLMGLATWMSNKKIDVNKISQSFFNAQRNERLFASVFKILEAYNDAISESPLWQKLGFCSKEEAYAEIVNICDEKYECMVGDWITERLGEVYRKACFDGFCQKVSIKKREEFSFLEDRPTIIEKGDCVCITEKDMRMLLEKYMKDVTLEVVKVSLAETDALEHDTQSKYLKNIYIPHMKKGVRVIAIKAERLKAIGEIEM